MKKTLLFTGLLTATSYFAYADTAGNDNTDTEKKPATATASLPASLLDNVLLKEVQAAQAAAKALQQNLSTVQAGSRSAETDKAFGDFVKAWKAVQATYIAGELDVELLDTPRLMDAYHDGKEDLVKLLQRTVKAGDEPKTALYKNTLKSINALAFYLYADKELSATEISYARYTLAALEKHLNDIEQSYRQHRAEFIADGDVATSYILNALIDSSYKLKEWRIGDPAGLSKKYDGKPDNRRQEYPYSQQSLTAMAAILASHQDLMGERSYVNLGQAAIEQGAKAEVETIRQLITQAEKQVAALAKKGQADFADADMKPLYETVEALNDAYYQSLVKALPVQAKILDADGD